MPRSGRPLPPALARPSSPARWPPRSPRRRGSAAIGGDRGTAPLLGGGACDNTGLETFDGERHRQVVTIGIDANDADRLAFDVG